LQAQIKVMKVSEQNEDAFQNMYIKELKDLVGDRVDKTPQGMIARARKVKALERNVTRLAFQADNNKWKDDMEKAVLKMQVNYMQTVVNKSAWDSLPTEKKAKKVKLFESNLAETQALSTQSQNEMAFHRLGVDASMKTMQEKRSVHGADAKQQLADLKEKTKEGLQNQVEGAFQKMALQAAHAIVNVGAFQKMGRDKATEIEKQLEAAQKHHEALQAKLGLATTRHSDLEDLQKKQKAFIENCKFSGQKNSLISVF